MPCGLIALETSKDNSSSSSGDSREKIAHRQERNALVSCCPELPSGAKAWAGGAMGQCPVPKQAPRIQPTPHCVWSGGMAKLTHFTQGENKAQRGKETYPLSCSLWWDRSKTQNQVSL